jgi:hypothetical protein
VASLVPNCSCNKSPFMLLNLKFARLNSLGLSRCSSLDLLSSASSSTAHSSYARTSTVTPDPQVTNLGVSLNSYECDRFGHFIWVATSDSADSKRPGKGASSFAVSVSRVWHMIVGVSGLE